MRLQLIVTPYIGDRNTFNETSLNNRSVQLKTRSSTSTTAAADDGKQPCSSEQLP